MVLFPGVVEGALVKIVSRESVVEELDTLFVVRLLSKFKFLAVFHEVLETRVESFAKVGKRGLHLLLFDVVILFILGSSRKSLPWK